MVYNVPACTSGFASQIPVVDKGEIKSPRYPYDVPEHLSCRWLLEAADNQVKWKNIYNLEVLLRCIVPARQRSCRKIRFSVVSVCSHGAEETHVTITHDTIGHLTIQGPPVPAPLSLYRDEPPTPSPYRDSLVLPRHHTRPPDIFTLVTT